MVYANNSDGQVRAFNAQTGARLTDGDFTIPGLTGYANGLAIAHGGATAYAITNGATAGSGGNRLAVYDVINETLVRTVTSPFSQVIRGAVNPADGRYYFASSGVDATMGVYDPNTQTAYQVGTLKGLTSGNGDFAFSSSGDLLIVANQDIFVLTADLVPTTPSTTAQFNPVKIASISVNGNGVAFGDMGNAFVSTATEIGKVNPANGQAIPGWSLSMSGFSMTDMASCAYPNMISLKKDIPNGRFQASDEFRLRIEGQGYLGAPVGGVRPGFVSGDTSGPATGVQSISAGPAFVAGGDSFTLGESGLNGAKLRNYDISMSCIDHTTGETIPATAVGDPRTGGPWTIGQPTNLKGSDVVCTISNDRSDITLTKTTDPDPAGYSAVGDTITYVLRAENTGPTALTDVLITDPKLGELEFSEWSGAPNAYAQGLQPGEWVEFTGTYTVTQADLNAGQVDNTAGVTSKSPAGDTVEDEADHTVLGARSPVIELTKDASKTSGVREGETVTYTLVARNAGNVTLTDVTIADGLAGATGFRYTDWPGRTAENPAQPAAFALDPGETLTAQVDLVITPAHALAGSVLNTATATGTPPAGPVVNDTDTETITISNNPAIAIEKSAAAGTTFAAAGDEIVYDFEVENTGDVTLTGVKVVDPLLGGEVSLTGAVWPAGGTAGTLKPGEKMTVSAVYTVTQADVDNGFVHNAAVSQGVPPGGDPGDPVEPEQPSEVTVPGPARDARIDLEKTGVLAPFEGETPVAGDTVSYTLVATNTGNVTLTGVAITDGLPGFVLADTDWSEATAPQVLAPGERVTVTGTYALTPQDLGAGAVVNVGTATGTPPNVKDPEDPTAPGTPAGPVTDTDPETVTFDRDPAISLDKRVQADQDFAEAGDTVVYEFIVTNTGTTSLTDLAITDDLLGAGADYTYHWDESAAAEVGTLEPGDSVRVTAPYLLTQADVDRGWVANEAEAEGTPPPTIDPADPDGPRIPSDPVTDDDRHVEPIAADPELSLEKDGALDDGAAEGDTVTYTFTVTNTGNVTLTDIEVVDPLLGGSALPVPDEAWPGAPGVLAPGDVVILTAQYELTQGDVDAGVVHNTATSHGTPPPTIDPEDPETPEPKEPIDSPPAEETTPLPSAPAIELEKTAVVDVDAEASPEAGDTVTYTFVARNTGNVTLSDVTITDPMFPAGVTIADDAWPNRVGTLEPEESVTGTATLVLTQELIDRGWVENTARTAGTPPETYNPEDPENPIQPPNPEDSDRVVTDLERTPVILVEKSGALAGAAEAGELVDYTFTITNTGNVTLTDVVLEDPLISGDPIAIAAEAWPDPEAPGVLRPQESVTASARYTLTQQDLNSGSLVNIASAEGTPPPSTDPEDPEAQPVPSPKVDDSDPHTLPLPGQPSIALTKSSELRGPAAVGSVIEYTLVATNTGNVTLTAVEIIDELRGLSELSYAWPGSAGVLAPGQSATAKATYTVTQADVDAGQVKNTAIARATPPPTANPENPDEPITSDPVDTPEVDNNTLLPSASQISLEKSAALRGDARVGGTIVYSFTVTNEGNTTLRDVRVEDPLPGLGVLRFAWPGTAGVLLPGESATATAEYRLTAADVERGSVKNTAVVFATDPSGTEVEHTDSVTSDFELLAQTGGAWGTLTLFGAAGALLLIAGGVLLARRSRGETA
ncbi:DUF7507 domain-containing protein [Leucobacter sp.]